jgi:hypothetical protein
MHNSSIGFTLIFTLCYECAFICRSWMETSCIRIFPLQEYLVTPTNCRMAMLTKKGYR